MSILTRVPHNLSAMAASGATIEQQYAYGKFAGVRVKEDVQYVSRQFNQRWWLLGTAHGREMFMAFLGRVGDLRMESVAHESMHTLVLLVHVSRRMKWRSVVASVGCHLRIKHS